MADELLARQLPQSLEAEQAVIGAMLIDPACVAEVIELLRPEDFYAEEHQRIFETIYSMFNSARKIDPVTVLDQLKAQGYYDDAGGRAYVMQLMEVTPTSANVKEYAAIVRDKSMLRAIATAAGEIQTMAFSGAGSAAEIAELAEQKIYAVRQGREIKGLAPIKSIIMDLYAQLDERSRSDSDIPGLTTGFRDLMWRLPGSINLTSSWSLRDPAWARPLLRSTSRSTRPRHPARPWRSFSLR